MVSKGYDAFLTINNKHRQADKFGLEAVTLKVITLKNTGRAEVLIKANGNKVTKSISNIVETVRTTKAWITNPSVIADFGGFEKEEKPKKRYFRVPVTYEVYDTIEVAADSFEDAVKYVLNNYEDISLGDSPEYVDGSYKINAESWETGDAEAIVEELEGCYGKDDMNLAQCSSNYVN